MDRRAWQLCEKCPVCGAGDADGASMGCRQHDGSGENGRALAGRVWCTVKKAAKGWTWLRTEDHPEMVLPEGDGRCFVPVGKDVPRAKRSKGGGDGEAFREAARREAQWIWQQAEANLGHAHVAAYMRGRGVDPERLADDLAELGYLPQHEIVIDEIKVRGPVLVAPCRDLGGVVIGVQRIMLDHEGLGQKRAKPDNWPADAKWDVKRARGSANSGGAVKFGQVVDTLVLCEGIETAWAIRQATGLPTWACISTEGLRNVELPPGVRTVVIAADNDTKKPGTIGPGENAARQKAADIAARMPGVAVQIVMPCSDVAPGLFDDAGVPKKKGADWLDVLNDAGPEAVVRGFTSGIATIDLEPKQVDAAADAIAADAGNDPHNVGGLLGGTGRKLPDTSEVTLARYTLVDAFEPMLGDRPRADLRWPLVRRGATWYVWQDGKGTGMTHWREVDDEAMLAIVGRNLQRYRRETDGTIEPLNPSAKMIANACKLMMIDAQVRRDVVPGWVCGTFDQSGRPDWDSMSPLVEDNGAGRPAPESVLAVPEGLLDIDAWRAGRVVIHPHTPRWFSPVCSPVRVPWARVVKAIELAGGDAEKQMANMELLASKLAPKWHATLEQNLPEELDRRLLQEFLGLSGTADMSYERALVLIGPSGSGKSTAIDAATVIYGAESVFKLAMTDLEDKYKLARLLGKNLAIMPDEALSGSADRALIMSKLAKWIGRDDLNSDRKFKSDVEFKPTAKVIMGFNEMPKFPDAAGKLARRFMPLEFRRVVPEGERDMTLKTHWQLEGPGILLWALVGLRRLSIRGKFKLSLASSDRLQEFAEQNAPVQMFIRECAQTLAQLREAGKVRGVEDARAVMVRTDTLFAAFSKWCEANHVYLKDIGTFNEGVRAAVPMVEMTRPSAKGGKRHRFWQGIQLSADGLSLLTDEQREAEGLTPDLDGLS